MEAVPDPPAWCRQACKLLTNRGTRVPLETSVETIEKSQPAGRRWLGDSGTALTVLPTRAGSQLRKIRVSGDSYKISMRLIKL